ncbi:fumarylacetoacetase [Paraburkholderia sp. C35]|uniref:fumarylacetoacetase n=1 Tax=Paraburkholderia sp. C35 TaxID=2126993 RepID=UPI000D695D5C|nr:fumarylacetoacetase [Paraburkholderia sp. C35]
MESQLNHTHDAAARSWVAAANLDGTDFPIQNLPLCVFRRQGEGKAFRGGVAIGDQIVDLGALSEATFPDEIDRAAISAGAQPVLNRLMEMGPNAWRSLRHTLFALLHEKANDSMVSVVKDCLVPAIEAQFAVPAQIGDYTDYYTSIDHATNIMKLFGFDGVGPNFRWIPLGYHGRASSIDISGTSFYRPVGQVLQSGRSEPTLKPSEKLDYELELAIYIGRGNVRGHAISVDDAENHVFGIGLLNDWSSRDIQSWEMNPLGPFLSKSFATTVSPWVVTFEALAPFRTALRRSEGEPEGLPYLSSERNSSLGGVDIQLEVWMRSARQRAAQLAATRLSTTSFRHQYWTIAQMVSHHTINGCNLRAGDVLGSGTISGPGEGEAGALIELARNGANPVALTSGEERSFVQVGDEITLRGYCQKPGFARIGFGESRGEVMSARVDVR